MLNCSFKKTTDLCVCVHVNCLAHTHTRSSGGLPEDLIESRELWLPWQRQLPSSITTRFLSFIVFIPSFFCCPLCFLQMSLCHDAFKVSHNAL